MEQLGIHGGEAPGMEGLRAGDKVFVRMELEQDDGSWTPVPSGCFTGMYTGGRGVSDSGDEGVQILPDEPLPRGERYATGLPWLITGAPHHEVLETGAKVCFRFVLTTSLENGEVT